MQLVSLGTLHTLDRRVDLRTRVVYHPPMGVLLLHSLSFGTTAPQATVTEDSKLEGTVVTTQSTPIYTSNNKYG